MTKKAKKGGSGGGEESVRMLGRQLTFSPVSLPASTHAASPSSLLHPKKPVRADALTAQLAGCCWLPRQRESRSSNPSGRFPHRS